MTDAEALARLLQLGTPQGFMVRTLASVEAAMDEHRTGQVGPLLNVGRHRVSDFVMREEWRWPVKDQEAR